MTRPRIAGRYGPILWLVASALAACGDDKTTDTPNPTPKTITIERFTATPNTVGRGGKATLSWKVTGASRVGITANPGTVVLAPVALLEGTQESSALEATTVFTLTAEAEGVTSKTQTVTVNVDAAAAVITLFEATPNPGPLGGTTTLHWRTQNATSIRVLDGSTELHASTTEVTEGTKAVNLDAATKRFTLEATGQSGTVTQNLDVTATQPAAEMEPNDTYTQANPLLTFVTGTLTSTIDVDWFAVTVPADGWIRVSVDNPQGNCELDTIATLFAADGVTEVTKNDDRAGGQLCSTIEPRLDPDARNLAAGTYYVRVEGYEGLTGEYVVSVEVGSKGCGNDIVETGELCDDGNSATGDGCDMSCNFEIAGELNAVPSSQVFTVSLANDTSFRMFRVTLPSSGYVRVETYLEPTQGQPSCPDPTDTLVVLADSERAYVADAERGDLGECATLRPQNAGLLEAGTYYVFVQSNEATGVQDLKVRIDLLGQGCGNGILEDTEVCDDGNTAGSDGCSATCNPESSQTLSAPGARVPLSLPNEGSVVTLALNITAGQSVTASVTPMQGGDCSPYPKMTLLNANFEAITEDFGGLEGCASFIAGNDTEVTDMAAGTYYLFLENISGDPPSNIELNVVISNPRCGNGIVERSTNEACDDGNTNAGDGCNAQCQLAGNFTPEVEPNNDYMTASLSGLSGRQSVVVGGSISPEADVDWWKLTLAAQASITARTFSDLANPTSCNGTDTELSLHEASGAEIAYSDDIMLGTNVCSLIDENITEGSSQNLPAGTYYLKVQSFQNGSAIPIYFLSIDLH